MTPTLTAIIVASLVGPLTRPAPVPERPVTEGFGAVLGASRADRPSFLDPTTPFAKALQSSQTTGLTEIPSLLDMDMPLSGPRSIVDRTDAWGSPTAPGLFRDPGRWRYRLERSDSLYRRVSKLELPDPVEAWTVPYIGRDWKAQEKLQIPVPIPIPLTDQMFVYSQFDGSGDAVSNHNTNLSGKTGVGLKWSLIAKSELQVRYATLFSYVDTGTRPQDRAQPAVEVVARMPVLGPWEIEYTGTALPALERTVGDQVRQELRVALPLRGDNNEFEFGARYRWDASPTPWLDRAQLFVGLRFRH